MGCALLTHVRIVTNQEAPVADQPLADGAIIQLFRRIPNGRLPGSPEFLFIDYIEDDLLSFCLGYEFCFGKALRLVGKFCTASDAKEEYIPRWQILKKQFDQFFQLQLTAFHAPDDFILQEE